MSRDEGCTAVQDKPVQKAQGFAPGFSPPFFLLPNFGGLGFWREQFLDPYGVLAQIEPFFLFGTYVQDGFCAFFAFTVEFEQEFFEFFCPKFALFGLCLQFAQQVRGAKGVTAAGEAKIGAVTVVDSPVFEPFQDGSRCSVRFAAPFFADEQVSEQGVAGRVQPV